MRKLVFLVWIVLWQFVYCIEIPLLARRKNSIALLAVDTEGRNLSTLRWPIVSGVDEDFPIPMTNDVKSNTVVFNEGWSKLRHDRIRIAAFNTNRPTEIVGEIRRHGGVGEEVVTSLAYDWVTSKIYVAIERTSSLQNLGRIEVCPMPAAKSISNSETCAVLLHRRLDSLHYLVVDPIDGYMYWINRMRKRIERAWMNGENLETRPFHDNLVDSIPDDAIPESSSDGLIFGLTLGIKQRTLFYIRTKTVLSESNTEIVTCDLYDRMSCRVIVESVKALELAVFNNILFWIHHSEANKANSDSRSLNTIQGCELESCSFKMFNISNSAGIESIAVFDLTAQPTRSNPCKTNNGGCSHICLLIPNAPWRSCICPVGIRLMPNKLDCASDGLKKVLLVSSLNGLYYLSLDTDDFIAQEIVVSGNRLGHFTSNSQQVFDQQSLAASNFGGNLPKFVAVDYDPVEQKVYWIDRETQKIKRCRLNGTDYEEVITEGISRDVDSLIIDWVGRNLVWSDSNNGRIELAQLNSSNIRRTIASHNNYRLKGLSFDWLNHKIYFANFYGGETKIERMSMDGSQREIFLVLPKVSFWLSDIVLEPTSNRLYWSDRERSQIYKARLSDASEVGVVARDLKNPNSISKLDSTIFYNSLGGRFSAAIKLGDNNLPSAHYGRNTSHQREFSESEIYGQTSLKAVDLKPQSISHFECSREKGGCDHICVQLTNSTKKCLCASGFELQVDERSCRKPLQFLVFSQNSMNGGLFRASSSLQYSHNLERIDSIFSSNFNSVPKTLAIDSNNEIVYWSVDNRNGDTGAILKSNFDREGVEMFLESQTIRNLCGLALDAVATGNIFLCNSYLRRIEAVSLNGKLRRTLLWGGEFKPKFLAISLQHLTLYFSNFGKNFTSAEICQFKYGSSGGANNSYQVLVPDAGNVTALSFDETSGRLFWSSQAYHENNQPIGSLYSLEISEGMETTIKTSPALRLQSHLLHITTMVVHSNSLYFGNSATKNVEILNITSEKLENMFSTVQVLHAGAANITAIGIAHKRLDRNNDNAKTLGNDICFSTQNPSKFGLRRLDSSKQCLCLPYLNVLKNRFETDQKSCSCEDQSVFDSNRQVCRAPNDLLLLAFDEQIVRFSLRPASNEDSFLASPPNYKFDTDPFVILPIENAGRFSAIEFDKLSAKRFIYWLSMGKDNKSSELKRASDSSPSTAQSIALADEFNCSQFFDLSIDFTNRQLFASCASSRFNRVGAIHVWKIRADEEESLFYVGAVVDGRTKKSMANNVTPLPKQLCVFGELGALIYVDHSPLLDSPSLIQCSLDGRDCLQIVSTEMNLLSSIILKSIPATDRLIYSTSTGIWSRRVIQHDVFIKKFQKSKLNGFKAIDSLPSFLSILSYEDNEVEAKRLFLVENSQHYLVLDRSSADVKDVIPINETFMLIVMSDRSSGFKTENLFELHLPEFDSSSLGQLTKVEWIDVNIFKGSKILSSSITMNSGFFALNDNDHNLYLPCKTSECSHLCQTKFASNALAAKQNGHRFRNKQEKNFGESKDYIKEWVKRGNTYTCMCPLGYGISRKDSTHCEPNVVCANWEFACHDGRACIHMAQRCNRFINCEDGSDELPSVCSPLNFLSSQLALEHLLPNNSKETTSSRLIRNHEWVCDDGTTMIKKYLLCDGKPDCADESDEAHCRCPSPADYFDCTAWAQHSRRNRKPEMKSNSESNDISNVDNCVIRAMLCDGRDHCGLGAEERKQLCVMLPTPLPFPQFTVLLRNGYILAAIIFALLLILLLPLYCICFICKQKRRQNNFLHDQSSSCGNKTLTVEMSKNRSLNQVEEIQALLNALPITNTLKGKSSNNGCSDETNYYMSMPNNNLCRNFPANGDSFTSPYYCVKDSAGQRIEGGEFVAMQGLNSLQKQNYTKFVASSNLSSSNPDYHCVLPMVHNHHLSSPIVRLPRRCCQAFQPTHVAREHVIQHYNLETGTTVSQLAAETPFCRCIECVNHEATLFNRQVQNLRQTPQQLPTPVHLHHYGVLAPKSTTSATNSYMSPLPPPPPSSNSHIGSECHFCHHAQPGEQTIIGGNTPSFYQQQEQLFHAPPPSKASQSTIYGIHACQNPNFHIYKDDTTSYYTRSLLRPKKLTENCLKFPTKTTTATMSTKKSSKPPQANVQSKRGSKGEVGRKKIGGSGRYNVTSHNLRSKRKQQQQQNCGGERKETKRFRNEQQIDSTFSETLMPPPPSYAESFVIDSNYPRCSTPINGKTVVNAEDCSESTILWSPSSQPPLPPRPAPPLPPSTENKTGGST